MRFSGYIPKNVLTSQVCKSTSGRTMEMIGRGNLFAEHDGNVLPVVKAAIDGGTNPEEDPAGLARRLNGSTMQNKDRLDLFQVSAAQIFFSLKLLPFPCPISGYERLSDTLGELLLSKYYVWDMQERHSDIYANSTSQRQSSAEIALSLTVKAALARTSDKLIPAKEKGRSVLVKPLPFDSLKGGDPCPHRADRRRKASIARP